MKTNIKRIMACLDLTEMDEALMRYTLFLCEWLGTVEKVDFIHNIKFDYPEEAEQLMEELEQPLPSLIREELEERAGTYFGSSSEGMKWETIVTNGNSTAAALAEAAGKREATLVVTGKKVAYQGTGQVAEKMLRLPSFKADLLMVPETASYSIESLLVPIDFSQHSKSALLLAHRIADAAQAGLSCQHVYSIPTHYFPYIPVQGFRKSISRQAEEEFKKFKKSLPESLQEVPCTFTYSKGRTIAQSVYEHAIQQQSGLIVLGSRGRSGLPAAMLGSVAIQLLKYDFHVPLLVVR